MATTWLKKIFRAEVIGVIVSVIGLLITLPQFERDALAKLTIREQVNNDNPSILITKTQTDVLSKVLPTMTNTSKYSLNNFLLQYRFVNLPPDYKASDDFTVNSLDGTTVMTYKGNTLHAHTTAPMPIENLNIKSKDIEISYAISFTFDGAEEIGHIQGILIISTLNTNAEFYYQNGVLHINNNANNEIKQNEYKTIYTPVSYSIKYFIKHRPILFSITFIFCLLLFNIIWFFTINQATKQLTKCDSLSDWTEKSNLPIWLTLIIYALFSFILPSIIIVAIALYIFLHT